MSVHTSHGIRCGNRAQHGESVVYHATTQAVKDCYAESGRFNTASPFTPAEQQMVAAAEKAKAQRAAEQAEAERKAAAAVRYAAWRSIPVYSKNRGYYAVEMDDVVHFFRVERPASGKHAGKTFVKEQAGDAFYPVEGWARMGQILDLIAEDSHSAAMLYATKIGRCSRCRRTLTDEESIDRGMGPECWSKWG